MEKLTKDITVLDEYLSRQTDHTDSERTLMQTIKLSEEVGELCEVVLQETGGQMRSKAAKELDVGSEIADVIICTLLMAERFNVDTWEEVDKKMQKVLARMN